MLFATAWCACASPKHRHDALGNLQFACGSSLKKAQDGQPESIEIQGNYRDELPTVIVEKLKLSRELIVVVVDGKRMKATELPE